MRHEPLPHGVGDRFSRAKRGQHFEVVIADRVGQDEEFVHEIQGATRRGDIAYVVVAEPDEDAGGQQIQDPGEITWISQTIGPAPS